MEKVKKGFAMEKVERGFSKENAYCQSEF